MNISILGCGWLGLPLGVFLSEKGFSVKGSSRDPGKLGQIKNNNIDPFLLVLDPELECENKTEFFDSEILILNIPPQRRDDIVEYHTLQIKNLISGMAGSRIKKIIFTSSTSVYPEVNREVNEDDELTPLKNSGLALKKVENLLLSNGSFKTTVLRLAGLIGYDRNPRNFLKNRRVVHKINTPVNLVHRDDCVNIIYEIIKNDKWGGVYNVCADVHPNRIDFYKKEAELAGIGLPEPGEDTHTDFKIIDNKKLKNELGYEYIYPDPLQSD